VEIDAAGKPFSPKNDPFDNSQVTLKEEKELHSFLPILYTTQQVFSIIAWVASEGISGR
jgi:hypothetical protein